MDDNSESGPPARTEVRPRARGGPARVRREWHALLEHAQRARRALLRGLEHQQHLRRVVRVLRGGLPEGAALHMVTEW